MARRSVTPLADDPLWYKDAVVYQLHVKSFFDANNDGIGDFAGLIAKLDYIVSLGVNTVWLLPFYPSPRKDDGYDIADYRDVSPDYGTIAEFKALVRAAHERGLRVVTELVINHTSDQHPWFQRARTAPPGSAARRFYVWSDTDQRFPETRIIFLDTEKSNWTWDPVAGAYFWHRFYSHQPDLNFDNPRVMREVLSTMRYWLDMGVDGLRLDAIPYLIEREGTNNENLPETHAILKRIRAELDTRYANRMLLAEANQWPEDTQLYFGEGDECHMAFHFPLMPRMYMAIAKEDRFPITDIMRQTPEIPPNAQWAIFLRNHDELTLEMVTDLERDYLWETYAADRRARINLGIRRRLAPLLQRDRRRIELMNGLLLSMPGTPVIYYGDEIGMGDNIHLGDRDGVRTPMQWSEDRNGGFSRADPGSVVLPPNMDPLYGFEAINVEAQARDPHSLLNWMRRMLLLRRNHQAFGRGTQRFLYPGNRRILAYLREYEGKTILCVANLARTPQAAELDLSAFAGCVPVEMTGPSPFPPIGQLTYLLTLPPYGFYWFELLSNQQAPGWHYEPPEQLPEFQTLVVRDSLRELLGERHTATILHDILPDYLMRRRWFASKNKALSAPRIAYAVPLPDRPEIMLTEIEIGTNGQTERYLVPACIAWEDASPPQLAAQLAMARVRKGRRVGYITDAFAMEQLPRALVEGLRHDLAFETPDGTIRFLGTERARTMPDLADTAIRWLAAEQSNSSLIVGNLAMVKLIRRVVPGLHPEAEMTRHLTRVGYANAAPLLGEVVRVSSDGVPHTLAIVQGNIPNQGDAWTWMLDNLKRAVEDAALTAEGVEAPEGSFTTLGVFVRTVGRRLGELHAALASDRSDPDFAPATAGKRDTARWAKEAGDLFEAACTELAAATRILEPADRALAEALLGDRKMLAREIHALAGAGTGMLTTRVHGDFHLGQVLVSQADAYIIDFEGEPIRPLAERRAKTTPLRDVAGFLRSLDYAAASVDLSGPGAAPQPVRDRQMALLTQFRQEASRAFLEGYAEAVAAEPALGLCAPGGPVLDLMLVAKAAYELVYEATNRPKWLPIPLRGLAAIRERLSEGRGAP
ncbi:maltose alpha-D-glucosyltransferase [Labrys wisconsinensis]|uniref:Maltokinase n=1 Tax=Labrys wisconsinensis TaxID=425677 RepID=A0ABU0JHS1_9HYPH|nr:maltose alpha-D-glucosyltransferase [Labrys wisconsinensis]MDQ0472963.1 maltose alpha-D-glucosyltransferase/alpha-amylase [Labrys wisconsinensis]